METPAVKEGKGMEQASLKELLEQQLELVDLLDLVIDEMGVQYGNLVKLQAAIGKNLHSRLAGGVPPMWISENWLKEALRNRLAMEFAEHSSGGGREAIFGEVRNRDSLLETFKKLADPELWAGRERT